MKLVLATRNKDKVREIKEFLKDLDIEILSLLDFKEIPEIEEDGKTFIENSLKKARITEEFTGKISMADDTGLVVFALGGAPGVNSSRFAGENATYEDNVNKLLKEMENVEDRRAKFVTVISIVTPSKEEHILSGEVYGEILREKRGENGFGYDPVFFVKEYGMTFAEMPLELKNRVSHRGKALSKAKEVLKDLLKCQKS